ncbi:hypothetical protein BDP55DRAFT_216102 [Colletotrichum godetiae]|uniref:Uncharacterized protein n=1 Tax=Colletotrichum godetiae TaxID=1209918 RepID=A0AAJ0AXF7_9PEZI|nr:uncharacterized protein BDP55DRAFT_216102 [Colletotrichum godetiae]KAK1700086.1 hypothetical protein BDP55DRAFT_216102 [Colletotrichum godetiae]
MLVRKTPTILSPAHKLSSEPSDQRPWGRAKTMWGKPPRISWNAAPLFETNVFPHWMDKCKKQFNPKPSEKPPQTLLGEKLNLPSMDHGPPPPALCERVPDATVISFGPSATWDPGRRGFPIPLSRLSPSFGSGLLSAGICPLC